MDNMYNGNKLNNLSLLTGTNTAPASAATNVAAASAPPTFPPSNQGFPAAPAVPAFFATPVAASAAMDVAAPGAAFAVPTAQAAISNPASGPMNATDKIMSDLWAALQQTDQMLEMSKNPANTETPENQSASFANLHHLDYNKTMLDGFKATYPELGVTVVLDIKSDEKLKNIIQKAQELLKNYDPAQHQERALALLRFCVTSFKEGDRNNANVEYYNRLINSKSVALGNRPDVEIAIGEFIDVGGSDHHIALLYKYLVDRTKVLDNPAKVCLSRRFVSDKTATDICIRFANSSDDFYFDFTSYPYRLIKEEEYRKLANAVAAAAAAAARVVQAASSSSRAASQPSQQAQPAHMDLGPVGNAPVAAASTNPAIFNPDPQTLRQNLQPLESDEVIAAREKWLSAMGTVDPYIIVSKRVDGPTFYVVHRPNGNAVFVSSGLWDPNKIPSGDGAPDPNDTPLPEIELIGEARESELGSDLADCWLYQCMLEIACTAQRNHERLRRLLRDRKYATMEVLDVRCLPPEYTDPSTGRACMLLGVDSSPLVPRHFDTPTPGKSVMLVTARLLTLSQWRDSQEFAVGKRPLALRFERDGTHHLSSILPRPHRIPRPPVQMQPSDPKPAPEVLQPSDPNPAPEMSQTELPDPNWTVQRLIDRVVTAVQIDASSKNKTPTRLTVPTLVPDKTARADGIVATVGAATATPAQLQTYLAADALAAAAGGVAHTGDKPISGATGSAPTQTAQDYLKALAARVGPMQRFLTPLSDYDPPISTGVFVHEFSDTQIAKFFGEISLELRRILAPNSGASDFTRAAAQTVYGAIGTQSQLYGWQHVSEFIRNPTLYIERTKVIQAVANTNAGSGPSTTATAVPDPSTWPARGPAELHEAIDALQEFGHSIVKRLIRRVNWMRAVFERDKVALNAAFIIECVSTDTEWVADATAFMKQCEECVAELLAKNPQRFNHFRELQKKGVQWPHAPEVRREIERAGLAFRPMMIKRDRTVCDQCGVEVAGWRTWYKPSSFHDFSKHPHGFREAVEAAEAPAAAPAPVAPASAASPVAAAIPELTKRLNNLQLANAAAISASSAIAGAVNPSMAPASAATAVTAASAPVAAAPHSLPPLNIPPATVTITIMPEPSDDVSGTKQKP